MLKMCKIAEKKTFSSDQNVIHPMDSAKRFFWIFTLRYISEEQTAFFYII